MREVWLARDRAERCEFGRGEPHHVIRILLRIGHAVEFCLLRGARPFDGAAELQGWWCFASLLGHDDLRCRAFLDNSPADVTGTVAFSTPMPCCRSSPTVQRICKEAPMTAIIDIIGREILDSRGNPTVEV